MDGGGGGGGPQLEGGGKGGGGVHRGGGGAGGYQNMTVVHRGEAEEVGQEVRPLLYSRFGWVMHFTFYFNLVDLTHYSYIHVDMLPPSLGCHVAKEVAAVERHEGDEERREEEPH